MVKSKRKKKTKIMELLHNKVDPNGPKKWTYEKKRLMRSAFLKIERVFFKLSKFIQFKNTFKDNFKIINNVDKTHTYLQM